MENDNNKTEDLDLDLDLDLEESYSDSDSLNSDRVIYDKYNSLESKSWFRLLKIIFIGISVAIFLIGSWLWWNSKPYKTVDNERSYIQCDRDIGKDLIYPLEDNSWWTYGNPAELYQDNEILEVCNRPIKDPETGEFSIAPSAKNDPAGILPNYKFYPVYKTVGTWWSWLKTYVVFLAVFFFAFTLVKEIFYYITTGKKIYRDIILYRDFDEL